MTGVVGRVAGRKKLHFPTLGAAEEAEADTWGSLAALAEDQP